MTTDRIGIIQADITGLAVDAIVVVAADGADSVGVGREIRVVGVPWLGGSAGEVALLRSCYRGVLAEGVRRGVRTIGLPVSLGVGGWPLSVVVVVAIEAVYGALEPGDCQLPGAGVIEGVSFVCGEDGEFELYLEAWGAIAWRWG